MVRMFKPQFATLVEAGTKRQTIRPVPKRTPKAGDIESWREWTGAPYRSKTRELAVVKLVSVYPVTVGWETMDIDGRTLTLGEEKALAERDGFKSPTEMRHWFKMIHGLPFTGILIRAEDHR